MKWLFEHIPQIEVIVRIVYKKLLLTGFLKKRIVPKEKVETRKVNLELLDNFLESNGVKKGDILIVHSSMKGIKGLGLAPQQLIDYLKDKIGVEGTLVMPTYPEYNISPNNDYNEKYTESFFYDINQSKGWTGVITETFRQSEGVVRSKFPCNTLAAEGIGAKEMFIDELEDDLSFGRKSAWRYCSDHYAKVLFLGIHAHHSISEIHIAEDMLDEKWPIKGWYTDKTFIIKDNNEELHKKCRVRKNFWTKYLTEYRCCYKLRKKGVLTETYLENIPVSIIPDLNTFEKYVTEQALEGDLLIFKIPRKFWKSKKE